ncbi:MAG: CvpA family protein [Oscillospiraceae bacterium]|nr:CvpA family protein [Oscillospiraceae bacterium]
MDNASVVDGVIAVVLIAGALIGAKRGLIKSLTGVVVVIVALVVSAKLAAVLTEPVTDAVAPKIEDSLVESFSDALERGKADDAGHDRLMELLERYGVGEETARTLLEPLRSGAEEMAETAREKAAEAFRDAVSASVRAVVHAAVHALLLLVLYVIVRIVLWLAMRALDLVFELPGLSTLNGVGGALFGLLEAALLLFLAVRIGHGLGWSVITEHEDSAGLLRFFLTFSPID